MRKAICLIVLLFGISAVSGCTFILQKGRRTDIEKIKQLSQQLDESLTNCSGST